MSVCLEKADAPAQTQSGNPSTRVGASVWKGKGAKGFLEMTVCEHTCLGEAKVLRGFSPETMLCLYHLALMTSFIYV